MLHIRSIDGLRGVAVLGVLVFHLSHNAITLGSHGVDLFFVISGFCLGLGALERGFDGRAFAWARAKRILPPYYAAILLGSVIAVGNGRLSFHHAFIEGARNLVFLSESPGLPTINGPFWTILLEFRWYVFFPFIFALYLRSKIWFTVVMGICAIDERWGPPILPDTDVLPAFMLGIVAADLTLRKTPVPGLGWAAPALLGLALLEDRMRGVDHGSFVWHLTAFAFILAGIRFGEILLTARPLMFLGRISYSLYLAQTSGLELLSPYHLSPWIAGPAVIGYAYIFYFLFERRKFTAPLVKIIVEWTHYTALNRCRKETDAAICGDGKTANILPFNQSQPPAPAFAPELALHDASNQR